MAVETIVPLLEMGVSGEEVLGIIDAALKEVLYSTYAVDEQIVFCACHETSVFCRRTIFLCVHITIVFSPNTK